VETPAKKRKKVGRPKMLKAHTKGRIVPVRFKDEELKQITAAAKAQRSQSRNGFGAPLMPLSPDEKFKLGHYLRTSWQCSVDDVKIQGSAWALIKSSSIRLAGL
jgi:hypothetical protein